MTRHFEGGDEMCLHQALHDAYDVLSLCQIVTDIVIDSSPAICLVYTAAGGWHEHKMHYCRYSTRCYTTMRRV